MCLLPMWNMAPLVAGGAEAFACHALGVAVGCAALALATRGRGGGGILGSAPLTWVATAAVALSALPLMAATGGWSAPACSAAGGLASAYLFCRWFLVYRGFPAGRALCLLLAGLALTTALRGLLRLALGAGRPATLALLCALVALSTCALRSEERTGRVARLGREAMPLPEPPRSRVPGVLAEVAALGFSCGLLFVDTVRADGSGAPLAVALAAQVACYLALLAWYRLPAAAGAKAAILNSLLLALCAAVFATTCFPQLAEWMTAPLALVLRAGVLVLVLVRLFATSLQPHVPAAAVFCAGIGTYELASLAAMAVRRGLVGALQTAGLPSNLLLFAMFCLIALLANATMRRSVSVAAAAGRAEAGAGHSSAEQRCEAFAAAHGLTAREREVLVLLCKGKSQPEIASALGVSANTVASHVKQVYRKGDVHTRQDLILAVLGDE